MTILAVAAAVLLAAEVPAPGPVDRFPEAAPSYLVAVDGEVVWARAPDAPRAPASLAKLLAALVALESPGLDGWLTVGERAAAETGSRIGLRAGEQVKVRDAVAAMLIASGNDACRAVAEHEAGSAAAFAARMNGRAKVLGLERSRFVDPCGHDAKGQQTTARDLERLARAALANAEIRRLVAQPSVRLDDPGRPGARGPHHQRAARPPSGSGRPEDRVHAEGRYVRGGPRHPGRPGGAGRPPRRPGPLVDGRRARGEGLRRGAPA